MTDAPQAPTPPAADAPAVETPAAPAPAQPQVSPQFQALAKKEQAIVKRQQELKRMEEELKGKESQVKSWEEKKARAKLSPLEALQELGLSYEEITQFILNDKKPTPDMEVKSVREELQKMREEQEERARQERESQESQTKEQQAQQVEQYKVDLGDYIQANAEKYELLAKEGQDAVELVYDTIYTDWQQKLAKYNEAGRVGRPPKVISTEEAAQLVEGYYEDKIETLMGTKKFSTRYQKAQAQEPGAPPTAPTTMAKTLNNGLVQPSSPSSLPAKNEADRIARALKALGD
jgi:hypothetical protein